MSHQLPLLPEDDPVYEEIDPETGEAPASRWGKKKGKQKKAVDKTALRIDANDDNVRKFLILPGFAGNLAYAAELTRRTYWHSDDERTSYCRGWKKNYKREYGPEYADWLFWCLKNLGPEKGWGMDRLIQYLNSEDRYVSKLGILKSKRDAASGKVLNIRKGVANVGNHLTAEDFLAEAEGD
jgi:hypothetical protein